MIAANKNLIKATLTQGVLGIHTNLVQLYTNNLQAIATQAALIAGFASQFLVLQNGTNGLTRLTLSYFYFPFYTICFVTALIVLSQATVTVTFGPSFALKGSSNDSVKIAAIHMFHEQIHIYKIAAVSITSLFLGSTIINYSSYPHGVSAITTCIYVFGYCYMAYHAYRVFSIFKDTENDSFLEGEEDNGRLKLKGTYLSVNADGKGDSDTVSTAEIIENTKLKARGIIWKRNPIEQGGLFLKYYAVLEKGKLDFFKNMETYKDGSNPVNSTPFKLWEYDIETDISKFENKVTSLRSMLTATFVGNDDFSITDMMKSDYDLKFASKNYRFALIPKVASELTLQTMVELVAHDEKAYNLWVTALRTVIEAYEILAQNPTVEQTMRGGTSSVDTIVLAANK